MASGAQGGGSSDPARNYHSDFADQFANADRKARGRLSSETQTQRCARLAAEYYSDQNDVAVTVTEANTGDSYFFEGKYTSQGDDGKHYYHAMFKATVGSEEGVLFFAELEGTRYPRKVLQCVILEEEENVDKCDFCSSIYHPSGDYLGKKE
ncbi:uncharacterized protein LOC125506149 [Triticum urartu]|uniref:uncharacterized protein LOC119366530 n=1 Tax=Triticum dicoccoides TaxID=85692 RepID=UPI0018904CDB|nr:uncharacterized protein LOC119366530 [Triticum dicoccoides]XP_048527003.1 uncharacterized protein LOC125506149 [Triticum urartu]